MQTATLGLSISDFREISDFLNSKSQSQTICNLNERMSYSFFLLLFLYIFFSFCFHFIQIYLFQFVLTASESTVSAMSRCPRTRSCTRPVSPREATRRQSSPGSLRVSCCFHMLFIFIFIDEIFFLFLLLMSVFVYLLDLPFIILLAFESIKA